VKRLQNGKESGTNFRKIMVYQRVRNFGTNHNVKQVKPWSFSASEPVEVKAQGKCGNYAKIYCEGLSFRYKKDYNLAKN